MRRSRAATASASRWPARCRCGTSRSPTTSTASSASSSSACRTTTSTSTCCTGWTPITGGPSLEQGQLESAERALADGRIRHLGFSFHGLYEDFETIVAATDLWEFVPDPVQLHGRGLPGRPQGAGAGGRQGPRRHRHGAGARRRHRAQRAAAGAGRVGRGARQAIPRRVGAPVGLERAARCRSSSAA